MTLGGCRHVKYAAARSVSVITATPHQLAAERRAFTGRRRYFQQPSRGTILRAKNNDSMLYTNGTTRNLPALQQ